MTSEFDAYSAATAIIRQYGDKARLHAIKRADALLKAGDSNGHAAFRRILRVIEQLQKAGPKLGEPRRVSSIAGNASLSTCR